MKFFLSLAVLAISLPAFSQTVRFSDPHTSGWASFNLVQGLFDKREYDGSRIRDIRSNKRKVRLRCNSDLALKHKMPLLTQSGQILDNRDSLGTNFEILQKIAPSSVGQSSFGKLALMDNFKPYCRIEVLNWFKTQGGEFQMQNKDLFGTMYGFKDVRENLVSIQIEVQESRMGNSPTAIDLSIGCYAPAASFETLNAVVDDNLKGLCTLGIGVEAN